MSGGGKLPVGKLIAFGKGDASDSEESLNPFDSDFEEKMAKIFAAAEEAKKKAEEARPKTPGPNPFGSDDDTEDVAVAANNTLQVDELLNPNNPFNDNFVAPVATRDFGTQTGDTGGELFEVITVSIAGAQPSGYNAADFFGGCAYPGILWH